MDRAGPYSACKASPATADGLAAARLRKASASAALDIDTFELTTTDPGATLTMVTALCGTPEAAASACFTSDLNFSMRAALLASDTKSMEKDIARSTVATARGDGATVGGGDNSGDGTTGGGGEGGRLEGAGGGGMRGGGAAKPRRGTIRYVL